MVSPELLSALSNPSVLNLTELPVLPVERRLEATEAFSFTPRRARIPREHEFFEDGDVHRHLYLRDVLTNIGEVEERPKVSEFRCQTAGCAQLFDTLDSYEHHYNTQHRNVCSSCKRSFPSARLLDIHLLEWHDSLFQVMAEKSNMYQCLVEGCLEKCRTSRQRKEHLIKTHLYPADFRFDKPKKTPTETQQGRTPGKEPVVSMDIASEESPVVETMEVCPSEAGDGTRQRCSDGNANAQTPSTSHSKRRVPPTICFGHGSVRGFRRTKKNK
ncbi:zinc finger protein 511 isoform X1 [Ascaphus truei]|uniref:zinc finger protein 511 isoform X1 n=1 Tax=Ascaphus truei TaxID=8439 RepID=UPI003F590875